MLGRAAHRGAQSRAARAARDRVRYHVCWGSWHGPHAFDPPLADVVDLVLGVTAGYYLIEQANPRHEHEWALWRTSASRGQRAGPGRRHPPHQRRRASGTRRGAPRPRRRTGGSRPRDGGTDCGFAQTAFTQRVHPEIQWAKLRALVEGAKIASDRLWRAR